MRVRSFHYLPETEENNMSKRPYFPTAADMQDNYGRRGKRLAIERAGRPMDASQSMYQNMNRGVRPPARPYRLYVPRTPGGMIVAERKYFDQRSANFALAITNSSFAGAEADPNVGTAACLFAPTQGNDISNREGRSCFVHKITIQGVVEVAAQAAQTAGDQQQTVRLILVMDKQTNGVQMNSEDLIESTGNIPGTFQFQNTKNFGRFQVLRDKIMTLGPFPIAFNGTTGQIIQGGISKFFKIKYTFKNPIKVNFNSTNGGTVADIVDNSFHLLAGRDNADTPVNMDYQCRVVFTG